MKINFLEKLQKEFEFQLMKYQLDDQIRMYKFLLLPIHNTINLISLKSGIGAKIIPTKDLELLSIYSIIRKNKVEKDYDNFVKLLNPYLKFILIESVNNLNNSEFFDNCTNEDSIYFTENATWKEFKTFFKGQVEQEYYKNSNKFSNNFFEIYSSFLNNFFKIYGPKNEEVDIKIAKPISFMNSDSNRTLKNYQKFLYFKNLIGQRSNTFYWNEEEGKKLKVDKFDSVIALKGITLNNIHKSNGLLDLIIYYGGFVYDFGYGPNWGLNKTYSALLKNSTLSQLLRYDDVKELIAFSKK